MPDPIAPRPHLHLPPPSPPKPYRFKGGGGGKKQHPKIDDPGEHSQLLLARLEQSLAGTQLGPESSAYVTATLAGEEVLDAAQSLASSGASLATLTPEEAGARAVVVLPPRAVRALRRKLEAYAEKKTKSGRPQNEKLAASLVALDTTTPRDLFEPQDKFPNEDQTAWWQIWAQREGEEGVRAAAQRVGIQLATEDLRLHDEVVFLARATPAQMQALMQRTGALLALRPPEIPGLLRLPPADEQDVLKQLAPTDQTIPDDVSVCILDAGVFRGHPLLQPALAAGDAYAYDPAWPLDDLNAQSRTRLHGTGMAGLALYGDLLGLFGGANVTLRHRLESVKILPDYGTNSPRNYGAITKESIARPEVKKPLRRRVYCLAVTAEESADGTASAWSAAVDDACFNDGTNTRLVIIAAGNIVPPALGYPGTNDASAILDPAQSWNALTIGGFTEKDELYSDATYAGWMPVAPSGALAPSSRTSIRWLKRPESPPIKPDLVMEAGNWATDGQQFDAANPLQLLTTGAGTAQRQLRPFGDTSAAAALAARCAARVWTQNPDLWPETVRALLVQSADWPDALNAAAATTATQREPILRRVGYGVPSEARASASLFNDVTLISQQTIQPFTEDGKSGGMLLYQLPWPVKTLQAIAALRVELQVTLSYFVQPKLGRRGGKGKYSYPSHQLRFDLKRSNETQQQFESRINAIAEHTGDAVPGDPWRFGQARNRGSLHSDIWEGQTGDLAMRGSLAVFPASGWWKESSDTSLRLRPVRFALVVTLCVPNLTVAQADLYAEIKNLIEISTAIQTET